MGRARTPTPPRPGTPTTTTIPIPGRPRTPVNFGHSANHINSNTRKIVNSSHIADSNNGINIENSVENSNIVGGHRENVQVVVRCRPISEKETAAGFRSCVSIDTKLNAVQIHNAGGRNSAKYASRIFTFDHTYDETCTQKHLYDDVAKPIVHSVMCGYNGTILAYGQTASGKTYTMEGLDHPSDHWGIIPNACQQIFEHIKQSESSVQFLVRASFLEIYNEEIRDLLAPCLNARLELKETMETGVYVKNLTSLTVNSFADINRLLMKGKKNRSVGATAMNQDSSRSHSIFTITVETSSVDKSSRGHSHIKVGKLNLVDLAGSERLSKTGTTGERFKEMTKINWSLSALGNVISALVDGKSSHIPYRDSKLTRLLQDSLGGNTRTVMVANIGPADYNYEESVGTLRYANRAKSIRNKPHVNEDPKDAIIREYQDEIHRLKKQLSMIPGQDLANQIQMLEQEKNMYMDKYRAKILEVNGSQNTSDSVSASLEAQLKLESLRAEKERSDEENEKVVNSLRQKLMEMELQNQALVRGTEDRTLLEHKLKVLEEKLLCGTVAETHNTHGLDIPRQQENDIYQVMQRVDEEKQRKITELEEAQLMVEEKCSTLEEEVESKTQKLKRLISCYQQSKIEISSLKAELQDNMYESHQEKEDLLRSLKCLDQQHQLKSLIIERFIPPEEVAKITRNIQWDEEGEKWVMRKTQPHFASAVKNPSQRPASAVGCSRPTCHWALEKLNNGSTDPRFLEHNILKLDLETPVQTTYNYNDPMDRAEGEREIHKCLKQIKYGSPYYSYNMQSLPTKKYVVSRPKPLLNTHESLFSRSIGH